jgi:hypothetical protein
VAQQRPTDWIPQCHFPSSPDRRLPLWWPADASHQGPLLRSSTHRPSAPCARSGTPAPPPLQHAMLDPRSLFLSLSASTGKPLKAPPSQTPTPAHVLGKEVQPHLLHDSKQPFVPHWPPERTACHRIWIKTPTPSYS